MCKLLLHCLPSTSGKSQVENVHETGYWLVSMQAVFIPSKIKHTDVYHQDINYKCLYLLYYTYNIATNKVSCLLYFRTQYNTQCVYNWCLQSL